MKKLFDFFFRNGRLTKSLALFMALSTVFFAGIIFLISHYYAKEVIINSQLEKYLLAVHKNFEKNINEFINQVNLYARVITTDKDLYNIVLDKEIGHEEKQAKIRKKLSVFLEHSNLVDQIVLLSNKGEAFSYGRADFSAPTVDESFINKSSSFDTFLYDGNITGSNGDSYIVLGKKFINFNTSYDLGFLELYIKESYLYSLYGNSSLNDSSTFLSCNNMVISHPDKQYLNRLLYIPDEFIKHTGMNRSKNGKYILFSPNLETPISGLRLYSLIAYKSLFKTINSYNLNMVALLLVNIIISVTIALILSRHLARSILRLQKKMTAYGSGEKNVCTEPTYTELQALEKSFYTMIQEIDELMLKNEEERRRQRIAELAALQAQINPHFVYNVLDAIAWMAKLQNQPDIERLVSAFASFFRIGLHKGDTYITIAEELQHLESYVTIEQIRFPDAFHINYSIDPKLLPCRTIKILLQPLVENCIKHGSREDGSILNIQILGEKKDSFILFHIIDDGIGLTMDPFSAKNSKNSYSGYGVYNINERIVLEYGNECGLFYSNTPGGGCTATIKIKALSSLDKEGKNNDYSSS